MVSKLAYLTGVLVEPSPVGRAGGLAAPARPLQQRTLQVTWHVIDLATEQTIDLNTFEPTESFHLFDSILRSICAVGRGLVAR